MDKEYLGDAVYARPGDYARQICLTTENGIETTNTIYLDPEVTEALVGYWERMKAELR